MWKHTDQVSRERQSICPIHGVIKATRSSSGRPGRASRLRRCKILSSKVLESKMNSLRRQSSTSPCSRLGCDGRRGRNGPWSRVFVSEKCIQDTVQDRLADRMELATSIVDKSLQPSGLRLKKGLDWVLERCFRARNGRPRLWEGSFSDRINGIPGDGSPAQSRSPGPQFGFIHSRALPPRSGGVTCPFASTSALSKVWKSSSPSLGASDAAPTERRPPVAPCPFVWCRTMVRHFR
jgi:hypothetical protein